MITQPPRIIPAAELQLAGLSGRYAFASGNQIPELWKRFSPLIGTVPGEIGHVTYGVMFDYDRTTFEYLAAVEVESLKEIPPQLRGLRVAPQTYAVFTHSEHISTLRDTLGTIWNTWLPASPLRALQATPWFERYDDRFDPATGNGDIDIWIPVEAQT